MKKMIVKSGVCAALILAAGAMPSLAREEAAATPAKKVEVAKDSLYQRIGGQPAIEAAVDLFYVKVLADERVNHFFTDVNMKKQHAKQKAFIAAALGGPVPYTGKDMRTAHKNLDLKEADFNVIAGHLQNTLTELKVDAQVISDVMAVVGSTKNDVLGK